MGALSICLSLSDLFHLVSHPPDPSLLWQIRFISFYFFFNGVVLFSFFFHWSIADVQGCANLCCMAKWLDYAHRSFFCILFHNGLSRDTEHSSQRHTSGPHLSLKCSSVPWMSLHTVFHGGRGNSRARRLSPRAPFVPCPWQQLLLVALTVAIPNGEKSCFTAVLIDAFLVISELSTFHVSLGWLSALEGKNVYSGSPSIFFFLF